MDVRRMALQNEQKLNVTSDKIEDYFLGKDRLEQLEAFLPSLAEKEYWDPVFQAWNPFVTTYLSSGSNPPLTLKYGALLAEKECYVIPQPSTFHAEFAEILKFQNTSTSDVFTAYDFSEIVRLCDNQATYFIQGRKQIIRQLYSPPLYESTANTLLDKGTWMSSLCAIYLYRHCRVDDMQWSASTVAKLQAKVTEWLTLFLKTFEEVQAFVAGNSRYGWYCDIVKNVIKRVWDNAMDIYNTQSIIGPQDVYSLTSAISESLVTYINSTPVYYSDTYDRMAVWDSLCNLYYAPDPSAPDFFEKAFQAMCIPKSRLKTLCDTLYDFCKVVYNGDISNILYAKKVAEFLSEKTDKLSVEEYRDSLAFRGFPPITENI